VSTGRKSQTALASGTAIALVLYRVPRRVRRGLGGRRRPATIRLETCIGPAVYRRIGPCIRPIPGPWVNRSLSLPFVHRRERD
jgi:hypothetical protein